MLPSVILFNPIDRTLTLGQSGLGSNGSEEVLHIPRTFKTEACKVYWDLLLIAMIM